MPKVNIRQLRETRKLKAWLQAGKTVELRDRDKLIARIVPATQPKAAVKLPDFAARRKKLLGKRDLRAVEMFIQERGRF